jgi:tetratricopeptide (TPR) repeat protein
MMSVFCRTTVLCGALLAAAFLNGCGRTEAVSETEVSPPEAVRPGRPAEENDTIRFLEDRIKRDGDDFVAHNKLAGAYLQRLRETGDIAYLDLAMRAAKASLTILPAEQNKSGLAVLAQAKYSSHDFAGARDDALRLVELEPDKGYPYQILGDAFQELGDYENAADAYRKMEEHGGVQPLTRVGMEQRLGRRAFLEGDNAGSLKHYINALQLSQRPPGAPPETVAWCYWQLGEAAFKSGDYKAAEKQFKSSLETFPNYPQAIASLGRVRAAQGDIAVAMEQFETAVRRLPDPVFVAELGDLYLISGRKNDAVAQYALVDQIARLSALSGQLYNRQLAVFYADHDIKLDEAYAMAAKEYEQRKDIYGADAVAWTAFKAGKLPEAKSAMADALRLGTKDARPFYHAGMIESALGNRDEARKMLNNALKLNPAFDLIQAQHARNELSRLN